MADLDPECDARDPRSDVKCQRAPGHERPHMHFGTNGTTAWGLWGPEEEDDRG